MTCSRTFWLSRVEMIMPVYGTAMRISAQIFAKVSSLMPLSNFVGSMSSAFLMRGTLIVCGPTPCTASRCSACMSWPANS